MKKKGSILMIDDDPFMVRTLKDIFCFRGYEVEFFTSGYEALKKLEERTFDCILSDIKMPDLDGLELYRKIKNKFPLIPVILMTAYSCDDIIREALKEGVISVVTKPIDINSFFKFLNPILLKEKKYHPYSLSEHTERKEKSPSCNMNNDFRDKKEELNDIHKEFTDSEGKCRKLIDLSPEGVWLIDKDGFTTFVNKGLCNMFGYDEDEMMGKHLFSFMNERGREMARKKLQDRQKGISERHEFEFIKKDGEILYTDISTSPFTDKNGNYHGSFAFLSNITERVKMEQKLAYRVSLERCLSDISRKFINIQPHDVDDEITKSLEMIGKFLSADRSYIIIFFSDNIIIKKTYEWCNNEIEPYICNLENFSMEYYKWMINKFNSLETLCISSLSEIPPEGFYEKKAWGERGVKSILTIPLVIKGKLAGFMAFSSIKKEKQWNREDLILLKVSGEIFINAMEKKRIEEELMEREEILKYYSENLENTVMERTKQLFDAHEKLIRQEKLAVMGQMAGGVGHELRNPLGIISNAVYFLRMVFPGENPLFREYLDIISSEVGKADKIISDLLEFSRTKSVNNVKIDLFSLVSRIAGKIPLPEGIRVINDIHPSLPPVYGDPLHMEQIFHNIIINAFQSIKNVGEVILSSLYDSDYARISIKDTGCGISEENIKKIFEPLFTTKTRGIGLGLSVTKKLVEANGGNITVESKIGEGTVFTVSLPVMGDGIV